MAGCIPTNEKDHFSVISVAQIGFRVKPFLVNGSPINKQKAPRGLETPQRPCNRHLLKTFSHGSPRDLEVIIEG
jgi:hypothetical protein